MKAQNIVLSRLLPKTGQVTTYDGGDDGQYEAGWWRGLLNANNKTRFLAKTLDGDDVVIDLATGLMWAADGNAAGCNNGNLLLWEAANANAFLLAFAGFTDWRVPNINELFSIIHFATTPPTIDKSVFTNTPNTNHWTSTTRRAITSYAWVVDFGTGNAGTAGKNNPASLRCVRGGL